MGVSLPEDLDDTLKDIIGKDVTATSKRLIRVEIKTDKLEHRILVVTPHRIFILSVKVPYKTEHSIHILDINTLDSKAPNQVTLQCSDGKKLIIHKLDDGEDVDSLIIDICKNIRNTYPQTPLTHIVPKLILPPSRMGRLQEQVNARSGSADGGGPCGGFSNMYKAMCDYHHLPFMEDVAWDVDTIYQSQDCRELTLGDFDHLDAKHLVPIIGALEHNCWFTKLNASSIRLTTEASNEILKVLKKNQTLEELYLSGTGLRWEFAHKMSMVLLQNQGSRLNTLDLSNNLIEDRGLQHLCVHISKQNQGMVHLNLSKTGISAKGLNRLAESLCKNRQMSKTLRYLDLSENSFKTEEISNLYNFLAQPNVLQTLKLANTECALENLLEALTRGCSDHLKHLHLQGNHFSHKKPKEMSAPPAWKMFFVLTKSLSFVSLAECRVPAEALKQLMLGVASNATLTGLEIDLSSNDLRGHGVQVLEACLPNIPAIHSLNLSDNGFDADLTTLCKSISRNRSLKCLNIGKNFSGIKQKYMTQVLDSVVQMIQDENLSIEKLSIADSKLKNDTNIIINALGSNNTLVELDISGNGMGDFGARMLAKALQINTKLQTIYWDRNNTTSQGFQDIAAALEKNYTLRKMPTPIQDATNALKTNPEKTETALQKLETLLQRNHSSHQQASEKAYKLQQGFLIGCSTQLVDQWTSQIQEKLTALDKAGLQPSAHEDVARATRLLNDAERSKQLLPKLHDLVYKSEEDTSIIESKLKSISQDLQSLMDQRLKHNINCMLKCTEDQCPTVMEDEKLRKNLQQSCQEKGKLPEEYTQELLMKQVAADITSKVSEVNLVVAAHLSDRFIDGVLDSLDDVNKNLKNHVNSSSQANTKEEPIKKASLEKHKKSEKDKTARSAIKQKNLYSRRLRPQSVIDQEEVRKALKMQKDKEATIEEQPNVSRQNSEHESDSVVANGTQKVAERKRDDKPGSPKLAKQTLGSPSVPVKTERAMGSPAGSPVGSPKVVERRAVAKELGSPKVAERKSLKDPGSPKVLTKAEKPPLSPKVRPKFEKKEKGGAAPMMDSDNDDESVTDGGKSLPTPLTPIEQPKLLEEKSSSEERLKVSEEPSKMPSPVPAPRSRKSVSPKELTGSLSATEFDNITTEPKLQHLVKSRPKRPKVHAASRTSLIRSSSIDDGLGEFFEGPPKQGSFETDSESSARASKESLTDIGGSRSPSRPMSSADDRSDDEKLEPKTPSSEEKPKTDPISPLSPKRPPGVRMALPGLGDAGGAALLADMKARQASRKNKEKSSPEKEINSSESLEDKPAETAIPVSPKKPPGVRMALPGLGEAGGAALLADIKTRQAIRKGEDKEKAQPKTTGSATESTREKEKEKITREKDKDKDESFKDSNRLSRPPPALKPKPLWSKPKLAEKPTTAPPKPSDC